MSFPKGFLWGGSISAAQIEGGWNEGGKSPVLVDYCTAGSARSEEHTSELQSHSLSRMPSSA